MAELDPDRREAVQNRAFYANGQSMLLEPKLRGNIVAISAVINAYTCDIVALKHLGEPLLVMVVDDDGHGKGRPVNEAATALYWRNCRPGTTHPIRGDVVIVADALFGEPSVGHELSKIRGL